MKYPVSKSLILLCLAGLSGCGVLFGEDGLFRDRGDDYLKAESMPPMKVPKQVNTEVLGQLYAIPHIDKAEYDYSEKFTPPRPEALSSNVYSENVKIQRLGDDRWIFVSASPSEVWPRVRNFLNINGLQVARTEVPHGLIETAWLNFKNLPESRDKYLLRIEQGVQPESAEIHVTHLSMPRDAEVTGQVNWPRQSSSAEREGWMVDELAAGLAAEIGSASASLLAQTIGGDPKVSIVAKDREPVLHMELAMIRAWATLNHALQQEGLQIVDENQDAKIYYVHYVKPEEADVGFFSGWFSRDEKVVQAQYSLEDLLKHMSLADTPANRALFPPEAFGEKERPLENAPGYLFIARENGGAIDVVVRDAYGQPLAPRAARDLLGIVRRNLI
jgi:outer membrane protein assembly factor BamC